MAHLTHLPDEILAYIAHHLQRRDIAAALQTCHQLQQALISELWKTFSLKAFPLALDGGYPVDTITARAHWVRRLEYSGTLPPAYYNITFPNLVALRVNFCTSAETKDNSRDTQVLPKQDWGYTTLIRLNPTIKDLHVDSGSLETSCNFWKTVFVALQSPQRLDFNRFEVVRGEALDSFWRAATRFEEVCCSGCGMNDSAVLSTLSFPRLQRLTVDMRTHVSRRSASGGNLEWFCKCPNLTQLHWHALHTELSTEAFAEQLEQQTWPRLTDLALTGYNGPDALLSLAIRQLPPLEHFRLDAARFGPQGFLYLRGRLFDTIRTLDLEKCHGLGSKMVLEVLTGCPRLEVFKAFCISVSDLRTNPEPWVCLRLKHLEVFFAADHTDPNDGELAFEQLSRLTRLETLDLNARGWTLHWKIFSRLKRQGSLQWRLDSGLRHLSTLRRLRTLVIDSSFHDTRLEDLQWMLDHWPVLQKLTCSLLPDPVTRKQFVELFRQHNVSLELEDGW
ncbi:hypothetical protein BGW39_008988 [Mortierella sp. 14UC]|nr:hypothetical protein BGW39_008988 [Mortierella sp. 14UC]